jgi:hypothetical protein
MMPPPEEDMGKLLKPKSPSAIAAPVLAALGGGKLVAN